ncbi:MFS transporter [Paucibacter sp. R3-3]|uniref:MFS transporter n=1 Tax=Roseateles agri TaxID=3098619 RepID=A0ABU5DU04_9BURK|nr:MFS transporter [Paucibacter sp. R3-3]MDY0749039.1 MFS transporter [Paucibacter sp. R3-3]
MAPSPRLRHALRYALIAALPFSDFLQSGVVAFNGAPIMGDISAGPEEYSLVATLYALVAIAVIASHRWLLERMGWRILIHCSAALFAAGAVGCARSESLVTFALSRMMMAGGCANFLTAGRLLVNQSPPSPQRFTGIRLLASGIAWGGVAGPLLASMSLVAGDWRNAFYAMLLPAGLLSLLGELALPRERLEQLTDFDPRWTLLLLGGSLLLLLASQRSGFDFFADPWPLLLYVAAGVAVLAGIALTGARRSRPLLRLRQMTQPRLLFGLAIFGLCYTVLGADNAMLPLLMLRGMNLPQQVVGVYMAIGALGGVLGWIALARLLPRHPGPSRYYLLSLGLLLACALQLGTLSETAHPTRSVLPALLCHGAFVITVLSITAMQAFQTFQQDETNFSNANQVKNILSQLGVAAGVAIATLGLQWRSTLHYVRLGESLPASSQQLTDVLDPLSRFLGSTHDPTTAAHLALAEVGTMMAQEATLLGALDYFVALGWFAGGCICVVLAERLIRGLRQVASDRRPRVALTPKS